MKKIKLLLIMMCLTWLSANAFAGTKVILQTSEGDIEIALDTEKAPISSKNFVDYVTMGFYDNLVFHRVIPGFVIQGGGADANLKFKLPVFDPIKNEAANGLKNVRGTIAMARTSAVDSATSQFFINVANNSSLNFHSQEEYGYAVFGQVISGMEIVDKIVSLPTKRVGPHQNVPQSPIYIKKAFVEGDAEIKNANANASAGVKKVEKM